MRRYIFEFVQGGQYILNLVDYFAGTFILVMMGTFEVVGVSWVYGKVVV